MSLLRTFTRTVRVTNAPGSTRALHATSSVLKKKSKSKTEVYDKEDDEDDMFGINYNVGPSVPQDPIPPTPRASFILKSEAEVRVLRDQAFEDQYTTLVYRCDRKSGDAKHRPLPRLSSLNRILRVTDRPEQLEKVVELLAVWRQTGHKTSLETSEQFIGRCLNLGRPDIALKVFAERPKYGLDIPSSIAARRILHSIGSQKPTSPSFTDSPINDALLLAGLYPYFRLPDLSSDAISLTFLLATLSDGAKGGENSQWADQAKLLLDNLKKTVTGGATNLSMDKREKGWMKQSLEKVKGLVVAQGEGDEWVQSLQVTL